MAQKKIIQKWYNGFVIDGAALYNPSLITRYFSKCRQANSYVDFDSIYTEDEDLSLIDDLLKSYTFNWIEELQKLLSEKEITFIQPFCFNINKIVHFNQFYLLLVK